jgi:hypothetical protein
MLTIVCRGGKLAIKATGTVFEPIVKDATVEVEVKFGPIRLLRTTADFCEQTAQVDLECPIEKGVLTLTKEVDIPNEVPPVCSNFKRNNTSGGTKGC